MRKHDARLEGPIRARNDRFALLMMRVREPPSTLSISFILISRLLWLRLEHRTHSLRFKNSPPSCDSWGVTLSISHPGLPLLRAKINIHLHFFHLNCIYILEPLIAHNVLLFMCFQLSMGVTNILCFKFLHV